MSREHVGHLDIVTFAEERVNLPQDKAQEYRAQARRLREKLEAYVGEHPDFTLRKMMLSGSLAKGTALRDRVPRGGVAEAVIGFPGRVGLQPPT